MLRRAQTTVRSNVRWKSWCQTGILSEREDRRTRSHRGQEPVRVAKDSPIDIDERSGGLEGVGQAEDRVATRWSPHNVLMECGDRGARSRTSMPAAQVWAKCLRRWGGSRWQGPGEVWVPGAERGEGRREERSPGSNSHSRL